eukprot:5806895-Amphidinium_carterae.1
MENLVAIGRAELSSCISCAFTSFPVIYFSAASSDTTIRDQVVAAHTMTNNQARKSTNIHEPVHGQAQKHFGEKLMVLLLAAFHEYSPDRKNYKTNSQNCQLKFCNFELIQ